MIKWPWQRKTGWLPADQAPPNKVLSVGQLAREFRAGDGQSLFYAPQLAYAWWAPGGQWTDYLTGFPLPWKPDYFQVVEDLPGGPKFGGDHPRIPPGGQGI